MKRFAAIIFIFCCKMLAAQVPLIPNLQSRETISLNGKWQYIIDPYETGFYNYRWKERAENDREAYWNSDVPDDKTDRKEHGFTDKQTLTVPGDWNHQSEKLLYYEGTVWYKKVFDFYIPLSGRKLFLHFGAVNYNCHVYLNGHKLGWHKGGFTPFNLEIAESFLKPANNTLVVKVDNKRFADEVPTLNTDWWNYGGITRDVQLVVVPKQFITSYSLQLSKKEDSRIEGSISFNEAVDGNVTINIPELQVQKSIAVKGTSVKFELAVLGLRKWSPAQPKLYQVSISTLTEKLTDKIGFKTIEINGTQLLLNGKPLFLRGICTHEEIAAEIRRAYGKADDIRLLKQAKELNANMVRLAHYPYNDYMAKVADSMGILLWSEIPVYWTIRFEDTSVLANAKLQLQAMIEKDRNRASIIIWSVGNETPVSPQRTEFMKHLIVAAKQYDSTRLVSAALENHQRGDSIIVDDPLGAFTDIVAVNEYLGWYGKPLPSVCRSVHWSIYYNKPFFISETGAEALGGYHADSLTRWSEEFQEWYYKEQVAMLKRMPASFIGISPWILNDFRSPKRNNPEYQQGWNNKGLISHKGFKKKAFYVLKKYYAEMEKKQL